MAPVKATGSDGPEARHDEYDESPVGDGPGHDRVDRGELDRHVAVERGHLPPNAVQNGRGIGRVPHQDGGTLQRGSGRCR